MKDKLQKIIDTVRGLRERQFMAYQQTTQVVDYRRFTTRYFRCQEKYIYGEGS